MVFTLLGGWLSRFGWRAAYGAFFLLAPCTIVATLCLPRGSLDQGTREEGRRSIPGYVWGMCLLVFLFYVLQNTYNTNVALYMAETGLGTAGTAGLAASLNTFAGLIAGCLLEKVLGRLGRHTVPAAFLVASAGLLLTWWGGGLWAVLLGGALVGFEFSTYTPAGSCLVAEHTPARARSMGLALLSASNNLWAALSPVVVNSAAGWFGPSVRVKFLAAAAALLAVSMAPGVWLRTEHK